MEEVLVVQVVSSPPMVISTSPLVIMDKRRVETVAAVVPAVVVPKVEVEVEMVQITPTVVAAAAVVGRDLMLH